MMPEFYGSKYNLTRAGAHSAWRYALLAEVTHVLTRHYNFNMLLARTCCAATVRAGLHSAATFPCDFGESYSKLAEN